MVKRILIFALLILTSGAAISNKSLQSVIAPTGSVTLLLKDVTLTWNAVSNTDTETVAGYNLYYGTETRFDNDGTQPSNYLNVINVGNVTNIPVLGLAGNATYYFAVTAVDQDGNESDFSSETSYTTPFVMDVLFAFDQPVTNVTLQWSPDFSQWIDLGTIPTNGVWRLTGDQSSLRFYRGKAIPAQ